MLPKARRLSSQEVESVMKKGRRIASSFFSLSYIPANKAKIAVIIPKKVAKTSVLRHKHKRRIMAVLAKLTLPEGYSIIMLRKDISELPFAELRKEIQGLIQ